MQYNYMNMLNSSNNQKNTTTPSQTTETNWEPYYLPEIFAVNGSKS